MEYPAQQWEVAPRSGMVYVMFLIIIYKRYDSCSQTIVVSIQAFDFRTINMSLRSWNTSTARQHIAIAKGFRQAGQLFFFFFSNEREETSIESDSYFFFFFSKNSTEIVSTNQSFKDYCSIGRYNGYEYPNSDRMLDGTVCMTGPPLKMCFEDFDGGPYAT